MTQLMLGNNGATVQSSRCEWWWGFRDGTLRSKFSLEQKRLGDGVLRVKTWIKGESASFGCTTGSMMMSLAKMTNTEGKSGDNQDFASGHLQIKMPFRLPSTARKSPVGWASLQLWGGVQAGDECEGWQDLNDVQCHGTGQNDQERRDPRKEPGAF